MQFSTKLFVSLVLPAAITILISFLWLRKKRQEEEELAKFDRAENDDNEDKEKKESKTNEDNVTESEVSEDTVDSATSGVQRFQLEKQLSATESAQQDSGMETKPSTSSEQKESSEGEESASEGSVESSSHLSFTEGFNNDTPPPRKEESNGKSRKGGQNGDIDVCEFEFPQTLCGRFIGRKGKNVKVISEKSGAKIRLIPQSPGEMSTYRIISVSGSASQIQAALNSIHEKFPGVSLRRLNSQALNGAVESTVCLPPIVQTAVLTPPAIPITQATLPRLASFDVVVTSVTNAGHFFVQWHVDFLQQQLQDLHQNMMLCYGQGAAPLILPLPQPIVLGSCCAAPDYTYTGWYRAQILAFTNPDEVEVKYLDYGGYGRVAASSLRQLR